LVGHTRIIVPCPTTLAAMSGRLRGMAIACMYLPVLRERTLWLLLQRV
jgi:hypothetical protein